jgi:Ca-activated chloride channel family protein
MRKLIVAILSIAALLGAFLNGGRASIGHLLLAARLPSAAAMLLQDPDWKGVALYSAGRYAEAARAFESRRAAGSAYNLGNALAQTGRYAEAIDAYDEALLDNPDDEDARSNRAILAALFEAQKANSEKQAAGPASSTFTMETQGDETGSTRHAKAVDRTGKVGGQGAGSDAGSANEAGQQDVAVPDIPGAGRDRPLAFGMNPESTWLGVGGTRKTWAEDIRKYGKPVDARSTEANIHWLDTLPDDPGLFLKLRLALENERRVEAGIAPPITGDPW